MRARNFSSGAPTWEKAMTLFCSIRRYCSPRAGAVILSLAFLLMLSGCWVSSISGLEETGPFRPRDPDVTFDEVLTGAWQVTSDNCTTTLTVTATEETYDLLATEKGQQCNNAGKKDYYRARLVKLDNHLFLDVFPRPDDVCEMCLALHWIFLVKFDKDTLAMAPINSDWFKKAIEQKTVTLATMPGDTDQLTASAKDLKAFCRKYADNKEVFTPNPELAFKRK